MDTLGDWFGLANAHRDFSLENDADAKLFFARHELNDKLQAILRRSFRTNTPPKLVLYGDWGVGKTHTMRHIEYVIAQNPEFNANVVFVELPDITVKSTFQVAHAALLDALGFERAKQWILLYQTKHPNAMERIRTATQSGDIATAFANLLAMGEGGRIAWDWLRGVPLNASDSRLVGLPQALTQSNLLVHVLQMVGRFSLEIENKMLVFMLDEATKLTSISNQDAVNHWTNALKLISDPQTREIGFIVSGSWVDPDDMALPLQDQQVMSRFGESNYIRLTNLDENDAAEFLGALLQSRVDINKRESLTTEFASEADDEEVTENTFPFTNTGFSLAVQWICRDGGITTPRDLQKKLDDLANRAIDDRRHILSSAYINSVVQGNA